MIDGEIITCGSLKRLTEKHCTANFLEITFKDGYNKDVIEPYLMEHLAKNNFNAIINEALHGRLRIRIAVDDMSKNILNLAKLFRIMETCKEEMEIAYYSLAVQSLEQIFMELSKKQMTLN